MRLYVDVFIYIVLVFYGGPLMVGAGLRLYLHLTGERYYRWYNSVVYGLCSIWAAMLVMGAVYLVKEALKG